MRFKNKERRQFMKFIQIMGLSIGFLLFTINPIFSQNENHPRLYCKDDKKAELLKSLEDVEWKRAFVEKKKDKLGKYLEYYKKDHEWLVSRLQMNWKTKHSKVFNKERFFSHSSGKAPVPTVRFSGQRSTETNYARPQLEEIEPYLDDERGLYLKNKNTGKMEWIHPSKTGRIIESINRNILSLVHDAAFLYWVTEEEIYAEFAESVFFTFIDGIYYREAPIDLDNSYQQKISGLTSFEVIHEQSVIYLTTTYDFLYNYFKAKNRNLDRAAAVFQKWGDQIISTGIADNNWNIIQARFLTYIALVLEEDKNYENGKGREYFFNYTFEESTERQYALKESILEYDQETYIWFESSGYSVHVTKSLLEILTLLDNFTNSNELLNYPVIEKALLASFQYLFPSGYIAAFGDGRHNTIPPANYELLIANYRKYNLKEKELLITGFLNELIVNGDYARGAKNLSELFFYVDELDITANVNLTEQLKTIQSPTFYAPNVSLFIQRIGRGDDAMMVSTVGSYGNHAHVNGVAIELFANNYVLGPDMAKGGGYSSTAYRNYYSQFPAHNTVVVDGISTYNRMRGYHPFTLDNYFPENGEKTNNFDNVTFSKVSFLEPETVSDQQRLTAQIKSKSGKGYIVDIFRSKKQNPSQQKHEYFYHNQGQSLQVFDEDDNEMSFSQTDELSTEQGDMEAYNYLTDKYSLVTSNNFNALFTLKSVGQPDNLMKMWVNGSKDQKIFSVKAPKSDALMKGTAPEEMLDQKIPTIILRRNEEAWTNPFAVVFNPYIQGGKNPVANVNFGKINKYPFAQKITVAHDDGKTIDIITVNTSENDIAAEEDFYQQGLLSIVRESDEDIPDFIFASGVYRFEHNGWMLLAKGEAVTASIENVEGELHIQNDKPVVLYVPIRNKLAAKELRIYEDGKLVTKRKGFRSRRNPDCIEFRLAKAHNNVIISFDE